MLELTIKYPSALLSVERRQITEEQAAQILYLIDENSSDYVERMAREIDAGAHPDSEWARERREGVR